MIVTTAYESALLTLETIELLLAEQRELERAIRRDPPCGHSPGARHGTCTQCWRHFRCDQIDAAVCRLQGVPW